jgi:hypothetical protein
LRARAAKSSFSRLDVGLGHRRVQLPVDEEAAAALEEAASEEKEATKERDGCRLPPASGGVHPRRDKPGGSLSVRASY